MEKMTPIEVLRKFFSTPERPLTIAELRETVLSKEERLELARLAAIELGVELDIVVTQK